MRNTGTTFYIEPADRYTKEYVTNELSEFSEKDTLQGAICSDGKSRDLWQCEWGYATVNMLKHQRPLLLFRVFIKVRNGAIKKWEKPYKGHSVMASLPTR